MDKLIRRHDDIEEWEDEDGPYFIIPTGDGKRYRNIDEARDALKRWREKFRVPPEPDPEPEGPPPYEPPKMGM